MPDQQRTFDLFRADYNDRRPHEALGQTPPSNHYESSTRPMPERAQPPQYGDEFSVRWVSNHGCFSWKGQMMPAPKLLAGQPLGLRQIDEDEWELHYGPILLGYVLMRDGKPVLERAA
jgi:hypothetical protein